MTDNKIIEGVGKRIVDALKYQSELNIQNVVENSSSIEVPQDNDNILINNSNEIEEQTEISKSVDLNYTAPISYSPQQSFMEKDSFASELEDFDMPANVAVLRQLITQLPSGVSRQTGAQIIKQTMEALGISMKSVLQEAQQVQENLNNTSKECQASILEHRKQIGLLEKQSQKLQKQSSALNDIISLFVQTSL